MSLDTWLGGRHDEATAHSIVIDAPSRRVWDVLMSVDFGRSFVFRALLTLRGMGRRRFTMSEFAGNEFIVLEQDAPHSIVLGMAGRPHRSHVDRVTVDEFATYRRAGSVRIVWGFLVEPLGPGTRLSTETIIGAVDEAALRPFRRYWFVVKPFSGLVRRAMLKRVKGVAERAVRL